MPRGHSQFFTQYVGGFTRSFTHDSAYMSETDTVQRRRVQNLEDQFEDLGTPKLGELSNDTRQGSNSEMPLKDSLTQMIMKRQQNRAAEADNFFDHLAAKYGGSPGSKKGSKKKKTSK